MIALRIGGILLTALSGTVLFIFIRMRRNVRINLRNMGIDQTVPLDLKSTLIVTGWTVAFIIGLAALVAPGL